MKRLTYTLGFEPEGDFGPEGNLEWLGKAHEGDAGLDLRSSGDYTIEAAETVTVNTGIRMAIPQGCCGLVLPRSGLASKYGLTIPNAPGLIDSGYRGEVKVPLYLEPTPGDIYDIANGGSGRNFPIRVGDRIAQLLIVWLPAIDMYRRFGSLGSLEKTERGEGGFGSSGR